MEAVVVIDVVVGIGSGVVKIGSNVVVSLAVEVNGIDVVNPGDVVGNGVVVDKIEVVIFEVMKNPSVDVVSNCVVVVDALVVVDMQ